MSKFLLLLGPSGVGKNTIVGELRKLDPGFVYISPYITRALRQGETDKVSVSDERMDEMQERGELLAINRLYGIRYATPERPIRAALAEGKFPVLDWPISRIQTMVLAFPNQLYSVYLSPPSIEVLSQRLAKDGRDQDGSRLQGAREELAAYWSSRYAGMYDLEIVTEENQTPQVARAIYASYLKSFR